MGLSDTAEHRGLRNGLGSKVLRDSELTVAADVEHHDLPVEACPDKTRADLELDRVLEALASRCASPAAAAAARALPFLETLDAVRDEHTELAEALALSLSAEPLPQAGVPDVTSALGRARVGASLSREEIRDVLTVLLAARKLRRYLKAHRDDAPNLARTCDTDASLDTLAFELERSFDPDGGIADAAASPRLADSAPSGRARAIASCAGSRSSSRTRPRSPTTSGPSATERFRTPVRSDSHERFQGIVHGASAGGATLFVEPRVVVPLGNRHKVLGSLIEREEEIVLARLGALVSESVESVHAAQAALVRADLKAAAAKLALDLDLTQPTLHAASPSEPFRLELHRARHPILALDGIDVVPSDLSLEGGRVLVVSGPNAGGKTVALKTMGLAVLMARLGLFVPASDGSTVSFFDVVLTDVGDEQSITKNLSTFSAHVQNLVAILDGAHPGALVLLDEVASGTDPREGEALATSILESLAARGAAVACTTHYEGLKILALEDSRFVNASVGFDFENLRPTFQLLSGVPGASSALAVARRFGVPAHLVARAESLLSGGTLSVAKVVEQLAADRRELEVAREAARAEAAELREKQRALDAERQRVETKERGALARETEELMTAVKRAREELRAAQTKLRAQKLEERELAAAEKAIDKVAARVAIGGQLEPEHPSRGVERKPVTAGDIYPGMRVFVPRLRMEADVLDVLASGQIRVAAGPLKLLANIDEIQRPDQKGGSNKSPASKGKPKAASKLQFDAAADPDVPIQTSDNTVDLRGLRAHEAIATAEQFLDRCVGSGKRVAFLIHGHGTGALRQAVRDALRGSPYIERSRPGEPREGGDGVTVVWLR
ncbi:MAG: Smr/MutS family protein [Polyangiaceae bacterium]